MAKKTEKHLAVALQGGGSHGAFTWGVLDRLLDEESLALDGFVGTSAGAMNAAVLAYGLHKGGRKEAKKLLEKFWKKNSQYASMSPMQPSPLDLWLGQGNLDYSPGYLATEVMSIFLSPYQMPSTEFNPLKEILLSIIDFESLRECKVTKLFVCATNVRKGRARVFDLEEMSVEAVLASANLPFLFKAVSIDGEDYWDGGYMGNPPIYPLIKRTNCSDVLLVQINPINIPFTPNTSTQIRDRVNELSFNSSLMLEMRQIEFVGRLIKKGLSLGGDYREIHLHNINPEEEIHHLNLSSKLNASWEFLLNLKEMGIKYADNWLNENYDNIGVKSTTDIKEDFL